MRRAIQKADLDRTIAESKQITADLMAARREATKFLGGKSRGVEDRLYLVLNSLHTLTDEVREFWRRAAGLVDEPVEREIGGQILIPAQPWLTDGRNSR